MTHKIDHFAIGAQDLESGISAMKNALGVTIPNGSKHEVMSTHNCVMNTGNETFFELIAVDPDAPDPGRIRWFTLDDPKTHERLAARPRALCWVVGTDDLDAVVANSPIDLGEIVHFQRGERSWRLTVPKDGSLTHGALIPGFIQWSPGPHPSAGQQNLDVTLTKVQLTTPDPEYLTTLLEALEISHLANVRTGAHGLSFELSTPNGKVVLD